MSQGSQKKLNKEESKILEKSEARDKVADSLSSSQIQAQESRALNSSSNSVKKSFKANNLEKKEKEKEEESDIEYDDVYVVEERTIPTAEIDNQEDEELNEELSLSLSSEDDNFELINSDYDKIKIASEKSKIKLERKKDKERLDQIMEEKVDFVPKTIKRDEVVEDFIRNFFTQMNLTKTLDEFNQEYAELSKKGRFNDNYLGPITDIYIKNAKLEEKLERMQKELEKANKNAEEVKSNWENLRKERDFHKENYVKTVQEKTNIANDIKTLQNLHEDFTSKIADLNLKYEHLCKNKSLMKLDLEKMRQEKEKKEKEIKRLQEEINNLDIKNKKDKISNDQKIAVLPYKKIRPGEKVPWPSDIRNNIYLLQNPPTFNSQPSQSGKVIKAYEKCAISCMTVHIKKNVVATGGDDAIFKIYDMSKGEELASGSYHNQYISSIDIHPKGSYLATASGDYTINLWDLLTLKVKAQFCHDSVVWSTKFHDTGDFLLSSNDNGLINLYDLNICQVRETYRGHTDSVNKINFQPFTNYFASASSDKSISIWDMRMGLTVQTFYGHLNSINDVIFNPRGDMLYSCDADGIIKAWDIRKVSEAGTWVHYPHIPANCIEVEKTNNYLYCGYDNGFIGTVNLSKNEIGGKFKAHEGPVNGIGINLTNSNMFTAGGDGTLLVWQ